VGIEVPSSSYHNDERGFSCCMLGSGTDAGPFVRGWRPARTGRGGIRFTGGPKTIVCAGGCCESYAVAEESVLVACLLRRTGEPACEGRRSFLVLRLEGSRGATVEPIRIIPPIEADPGRPLNKGQGQQPLVEAAFRSTVSPVLAAPFSSPNCR